MNVLDEGGPAPRDRCPRKRQERRDPDRGSDGRDEPRATCSPQTLAEAERSLPSSLWREQALPTWTSELPLDLRCPLSGAGGG